MHAQVRCLTMLAAACLAQCAFSLGAATAQVTLYVDDDAPLGGDGRSWDTALTFLADAISAAAIAENDVIEIHVAQGTYQPDRWILQPNGSHNTTWTFRLHSGLAIRGGYAGVGAADPDARDFESFTTVLSGDLLGNDDGTNSHLTDNSLHVVSATSVDSTAVLEGVTITAGRVIADYEQYQQGAAINVLSGSPAIRHCVIKRNYSQNGGGSAIYFKYGNPELSNCQISRNGMVGVSFHGPGQPSLANCVFVENSSAALRTTSAINAIIGNCTFTNINADAIAISPGGAATITNCVFDGNERGMRVTQNASSPPTTVSNSIFSNHLRTGVSVGGGTIRFSDCQFIDNAGGGIGANCIDFIAEGCLFQNNIASYDSELCNGGAIHNSRNWTVMNCRFENNSAAYGGALFNGFRAVCKAINCSFVDNFAQEWGGAVCNQLDYYYATILSSTFINCVFFRNEASDFGGAIFSRLDDLRIINCTLALNEARSGGGVFSASGAKLRVFNSILRNNGGGSIGGNGMRVVRYSNIAGGHIGRGNINKTAWFVDSIRGDFRLRPTSPCIDSGRNSYLPPYIVQDVAGNSRFRDAPAPDTGVGSPDVVDMGAYEFQP